MLFKVFNKKEKSIGMISAFDFNSANRSVKKALGLGKSRLPKYISVVPVSQKELEAMMAAQQVATDPVETEVAAETGVSAEVSASIAPGEDTPAVS